MNGSCIQPKVWYNRDMKQITETQFFDSLLGDTMTEKTYSILNPYTGKPILEQVPASRLDEFVAYFQNLTGLSDLPVIETEPTKDLGAKAIWDRYIKN